MMVTSKRSKRMAVVKMILFLLFFVLIVGGFGLIFSLLTGKEMSEFDEGMRARDRAIASGAAVATAPATPGQTETTE
ncbi:MAG: hypothetical protein VZQ83_04170 [Eubacterium sp.]|nr:hypothetical protein [Eubacterium sp.]